MPRRTSSLITKNADGTASVELSNGICAVIDAVDIPLVANHKWHAYRCGKVTYAGCNHRLSYKRIPMHTVIAMHSGIDKTVDHIDRNGLNNTRSNLRLATSTVQKLNQGIRNDNDSSLSGVHLRPDGKWQARISVSGERRSLGTFDRLEDAIRCMGSVRRIVDELLGQIKICNEY